MAIVHSHGVLPEKWQAVFRKKHAKKLQPMSEKEGKKRYASRPISRVLSWTAIHLGRPLLGASSNQPG